MNRSFEQLFGIDRERATGRSDEELFPAELASRDAGQRPARDARARAAPGRGGDRAPGRPAHLPVREVPAARRRRASRTRCARSRPTSPSASAPSRRCASPSSTSAGSSTRRTTRSCRSTSPGASRPGTRRPRQTFGWTEAEALGRSFAETDHPGAPPRRAQPARSSGSWRPGKASLLDRRVELEALHRDGHEFPVEMTISAVRVGGPVRLQRVPARHHRAQAGRGDAAAPGGHRAVLARRDHRDHARRGRSRAGTRAPRELYGYRGRGGDRAARSRC